MREGGATPEERIALMFRLTTARRPDARETAELLANYRDQLAEYTRDAEAAKKLVAVGATPPDAKLNPGELAAYTMVANLILNIDEVITKRRNGPDGHDRKSRRLAAAIFWGCAPRSASARPPWLSLAARLAAAEGRLPAHGGLPGLPHFAPTAKRATHLFMAGALSQMDMFDYKPKLTDLFDKDLPDSIRQGSNT